jgi:hypothetical protein
MSDNPKSDLDKVQMYRNIVLQYEAVDAEIDALLMSHGGGSEKMSDDERARYRQLANRRDELLNEMRLLEMQLLDDEDEITP